MESLSQGVNTEVTSLLLIQYLRQFYIMYIPCAYLYTCIWISIAKNKGIKLKVILPPPQKKEDIEQFQPFHVKGMISGLKLPPFLS